MNETRDCLLEEGEVDNFGVCAAKIWAPPHSHFSALLNIRPNLGAPHQILINFEWHAIFKVFNVQIRIFNYIEHYIASYSTPVIHFWCFRCIACVEHVYFTCIDYTWITPVLLHMYDLCSIYTCITHLVLHMQFYNLIMYSLYTCITCVGHMYYKCSTHVIQVYELHVWYTRHITLHNNVIHM